MSDGQGAAGTSTAFSQSAIRASRASRSSPNCVCARARLRIRMRVLLSMRMRMSVQLEVVSEGVSLGFIGGMRIEGTPPCACGRAEGAGGGVRSW